MNEVDEIRYRMAKRKSHALNDRHFFKFYHFVIRIMVAIVVGISVFSLATLYPDHTLLKKVILEDIQMDTAFQVIEHYFEPFFDQDKDTLAVSQEVNYEWVEKNEYKNNTNQVISLGEGTVIYLGNQDLLDDFMIIQSISGVKITYAKVQDIPVSLYDYVHTGDILGTYSNKMMMIFEYDGKEISYEEAIKML